ncbi:hypothetical protein R2R70_02770 [Cobetia sp. SIMBA_158]|uniref:hypothetical protein n=1 Tax=Cobetia sp. SIMBA_158 TaxID=3081617 RepID=UPI00397F1F78
MVDYPVKWFSNDMGGAPVLGDTAAGDFIALLKACLVTGFNVTPVASATYEAESGEVLVTLTTGHGFKAWQVIEISGADQESYNGQHRVTSIGSDWVRYVPDAAPSVSPATGTTIEIKAAPVGGWQVDAENVDTHKLALSRMAADATDMTFIIANGEEEGERPTGGEMVANVRVCESFTDLDTYTEVARQYWPASSNYASAEWFMVADGYIIYWVIRYGSSGKRSATVLGDIVTVRPGDAYHCIINGIQSGSNSDWNGSERYYSDLARFGSTERRSIARAYHQLPGNTVWKMQGIGDGFGNTMDYPTPQTNGFYVNASKLMIIESGGLRGFAPGLVQPLQTSSAYHGAVIDNLPNFEGVPIIFWLMMNYDYDSSDGSEVLVGFRLDSWRGEVG